MWKLPLEVMCCLLGPEGNLLHCRVSVVKTIKALPDMLTLFETIVKQCNFESLWVYRRQAVPISNVCNNCPYDGIICLLGESFTGLGGINTHQHTQAHVPIKHSPTAGILAAKLLAFICHLMHFYIYGHIETTPISFRSITICLYALAGNGAFMKGKERSLITCFSYW